MGKLQHLIVAGLFCIVCSAQSITIELNGQKDSIAISRIINRVGEIKMDGVRFKLVVWRSYRGRDKYLVIRSIGGEFGYEQMIKQKDGVVVAFRRRLKKIPVIINEVQLKQKQ